MIGVHGFALGSSLTRPGPQSAHLTVLSRAGKVGFSVLGFYVFNNLKSAKGQNLGGFKVFFLIFSFFSQKTVSNGEYRRCL